MHHAHSTQPLFTPSMFDTLLQRWKSLPRQDGDSADASPGACMARAQAILRKTVESHLPHLAPRDQALVARLVNAHAPQVWRDHLFDCFDLVARTRGAAIAVLHLRDLHSLLQVADPAQAPRPLRKRALATA